MANPKDPKQKSGEAKQPASIFISGGLWIDIDPTPTGESSCPLIMNNCAPNVADKKAITNYRKICSARTNRGKDD
jgi:hypothetical protein